MCVCVGVGGGYPTNLPMDRHPSGIFMKRKHPQGKRATLPHLGAIHRSSPEVYVGFSNWCNLKVHSIQNFFMNFMCWLYLCLNSDVLFLPDQHKFCPSFVLALLC